MQAPIDPVHIVVEVAIMEEVGAVIEIHAAVANARDAVPEFAMEELVGRVVRVVEVDPDIRPLNDAMLHVHLVPGIEHQAQGDESLPGGRCVGTRGWPRCCRTSLRRRAAVAGRG